MYVESFRSVEFSLGQSVTHWIYILDAKWNSWEVSFNYTRPENERLIVNVQILFARPPSNLPTPSHPPPPPVTTLPSSRWYLLFPFLNPFSSRLFSTSLDYQDLSIVDIDRSSTYKLVADSIYSAYELPVKCNYYRGLLLIMPGRRRLVKGFMRSCTTLDKSTKAGRDDGKRL